MNNKINKISPLPNMLLTIGLLPSSYLVSMTYEEQLLWLCNFLKTEVIPKTNANIEAVNNLITYIDNYFDNLDVQEEIDNKLNEMIQSGELQEIITEYLQINGVLGYDTVADMVSATNIINGSICRTLGLNTYNDGKGEFYKIRTITSGDTVDGVNIIALNISNTLIAEKIPDYYLNKEVTDRTNADNSLQNQIDLINSGKYIFIGDSYGDNENSSYDEFTRKLRDLMIIDNSNLTTSDFYIWNVGGARAIQNISTDSTYLSQLQNNSNVISSSDKLKVKGIFLLAGHNDTLVTKNALVSALGDLYSYAKTNYPNATIYIGCIGYSAIKGDYEIRLGINNIVIPAYKEAVKFGYKYINNVEYIMRDYTLYDSTLYHPNENGHNLLARCIYNSITNGDIVDYEYGSDSVELVSGVTFDSNANMVINYIKNNDKLNINIKGLLGFTNLQNTNNYNLNVNLFNIENTKLFRYYSNNFNLPVTCYTAYSDGTIKNLSGYLQFGANYCRLYLFNVYPDNTKTINGMRIYCDQSIDRINC